MRARKVVVYLGHEFFGLFDDPDEVLFVAEQIKRMKLQLEALAKQVILLKDTEYGTSTEIFGGDREIRKQIARVVQATSRRVKEFLDWS